MATYVITGRDVNLSFAGGTDIDAQATSAVLTKTNDRQVKQLRLQMSKQHLT